MTRTTRSKALLCAALEVLAALSVVACGSASERPPTSGGGAGTSTNATGASQPPPGDDVATGSCELGQTRDCRVWLPEVNGIKNCLVGTQVCVSDVWSDCMSDTDAAELLAANGF